MVVTNQGPNVTKLCNEPRACFTDVTVTIYQHFSTFAILSSKTHFTNMNFITAWISKYIPYEVWDEIIYPFSKSNGEAIDIWDGYVVLSHI